MGLLNGEVYNKRGYNQTNSGDVDLRATIVGSSTVSPTIIDNETVTDVTSGFRGPYNTVTLNSVGYNQAIEDNFRTTIYGISTLNALLTLRPIQYIYLTTPSLRGTYNTRVYNRIVLNGTDPSNRSSFTGTINNTTSLSASISGFSFVGAIPYFGQTKSRGGYNSFAYQGVSYNDAQLDIPLINLISNTEHPTFSIVGASDVVFDIIGANIIVPGVDAITIPMNLLAPVQLTLSLQAPITIPLVIPSPMNILLTNSPPARITLSLSDI